MYNENCMLMKNTTSAALADNVNSPMDIICNGFGIKKTILSVLEKYQELGWLQECDIDELAEEITEEFAIKLRLKQGK